MYCLNVIKINKSSYEKYFTAFLFTGVTLFTPADAYIKTRRTVTSTLEMRDAVTMHCFSIRFPCNGRLDDFLNAVNEQRPLTLLTDPNELTVLMDGARLNTNGLSGLQGGTKGRIVTTENRKYSSLKKDLVERLSNDRSSLINKLSAAYDALPEEGNVDDIPYLNPYAIDMFADNAKRIYDAVHQYVNPEDRYPTELFENLLYNEIRSAAFDQPEGASQNIYTTHDIKLCIFPNQIHFDINGEILTIDTASDSYRKKLKKEYAQR